MNRLTSPIPRVVFALVLIFLIAGTLLPATAGDLRLILVVNKSNYETVTQAVQQIHGVVNYAYKYADGIAVTIPAEKLPAILSRADVVQVLKDETVSLPNPQRRDVPGYGALPAVYTTEAPQGKALSPDDLQGILHNGQNNYYPFDNQLTHALDFWSATHHIGENIIVGIIDAGVSRGAIAVAGPNGERIVGAENFTADGIPGDSPLNGQHGTWVACCVGANAVFGFSSTDPLVQAVQAFAPGSVIPNLFGPGIDGIPMVGQAPGVRFYSLKVFPANANSTSRSIIGQAMERAIELKEAFNHGAGGVNIQVVNLSIGGANLFAGNDPIYAPLVKRAEDAGIVLTISAGNAGPAGLTIGTPGDSKSILSAAASSDAVHVRILAEAFFGPGLGKLYRPLNNNLIVDFSSRGPTADGRMGANIAAPGDWRYAQGADGFIYLVSGTSFSAPTVAGAAALLFSAHPGATPEQIRGALLAGANSKLLDDKPQKVDQGFGFLDVAAAQARFGAPNPPDLGLQTPLVRVNVAPFGIQVMDAQSFSRSTGWLVPGQRKEYYVQTTVQPLAGMTVTVNVTPELPRSKQNALFGDDALVTIASGKTSTGDYRAASYVPGSQTFVLGESDLDMGITRVTVTGDVTNAGRIKADVQVTRGSAASHLRLLAQGQIAQGQVQELPVNIPPGKAQVRFVLGWLNGWEALPTNDLDIVLIDPSGHQILADNDGDGDPDGLSLDTPERVTLINPVAGQWTMLIAGFAVWSGSAGYLVFSDVNTPYGFAKPAAGQEGTSSDVPTSYVLLQNFPNPFNPSTIIRYGLPVDTHVRLTVYNALGQEVAALVNEDQQAGYHQAVFSSTGLASGVYFYRLQAGQFQSTYKMLLLQ